MIYVLRYLRNFLVKTKDRDKHQYFVRSARKQKKYRFSCYIKDVPLRKRRMRSSFITR